MTEGEYNRIMHRRRYLPLAIYNTRRKLRQLEAEAASLGMNDLLTNPEHVNVAWDQAIADAQSAAEASGGSIGFGETIR